MGSRLGSERGAHPSAHPGGTHRHTQLLEPEEGIRRDQESQPSGVVGRRAAGQAPHLNAAALFARFLCVFNHNSWSLPRPRRGRTGEKVLL